ncbi:RHS repeat-associated core domain-containing protein, partial [Candidatus Woesearchaeota archaeon]|nr:RHS repeat-associated core domain-containing protein [Candidatus Woesearchaeota archaeon]
MKTYKYDAYGKILQETGPSFNRGFTYTGRERHYRSGLYYYRYRWYDSQTGRFITQDPAYYVGGINLYAYCGDDPVNWVDPLGLAKCYYYIGYHTLVCVSDDGKSRAVIGPHGIFSGSNEYMNDPSFTSEY